MAESEGVSDVGNNAWHINKGNYRAVVVSDDNANWVLTFLGYATHATDKKKRALLPH